MRMKRYSKSCHHFVKGEFPRSEGIKTLKKQHVELFSGKSQYELRVNTDKHGGLTPKNIWKRGEVLQEKRSSG